MSTSLIGAEGSIIGEANFIKILEEESNNGDKHYAHRVEATFIVEDLDPDEIIGAIEAACFRDCGCSHDCCGHWFGGAMSIHRVDNDLYIVISRYQQNV